MSFSLLEFSNSFAHRVEIAYDRGYADGRSGQGRDSFIVRAAIRRNEKKYVESLLGDMVDAYNLGYEDGVRNRIIG